MAILPSTPRWHRILIVVGLVSCAASAPGLDVKETPGGGMQITARGEALATVLELVAKKAGVTIEYDGPPPHEKIFADLSSATATEAILRVLEGHKIGYAAQYDASGRRMQRLVLVTKKARASPGPSVSPIGRRGGAFRPPPEELPEDPLLDAEPPEEEPEPPEEAAPAEDAGDVPAEPPVDEDSPFRVIPVPTAPSPNAPPADPPVPPPPTGDDDAY